MYYIDQSELKSLYDLGFKKSEKKKEKIRMMLLNTELPFFNFFVITCFLISVRL